MTDRDDIEMLAAEYALGTLDADERSEVAARRQREADLDAAITAWETRLSPLLERAGDAAPRAGLLAEIQKEIAAREASGGGSVVELRRQVTRWKTIASGAMAMAACLFGLVIYTGALQPPQEQQFVAVFQDGDAPPRFIMSVNLKTRELTVRPVAAELPAGKTYQLWIVSDKLAPGPHSLGLLDKPGNPTRKKLRQFTPELLQNATFGISVEPEGGSPTGKPSPGALHGTLIPATF